LSLPAAHRLEHQDIKTALTAPIIPRSNHQMPSADTSKVAGKRILRGAHLSFDALALGAFVNAFPCP
jgi:hypothetical protein